MGRNITPENPQMEVFINEGEYVNDQLGITEERQREMHAGIVGIIKHHYGGESPTNPTEQIYIASMVAANPNELAFYCIKIGLQAAARQQAGEVEIITELL